MMRLLLTLALVLMPRPAAAQVAPAAAPEAPAPNGSAVASIEALRADIDRIIRGTGWRNDRWGVMVVSLTHGDTLYALEAGTPLTPASNVKLLTTAAALHYLGAGFRFNTFLLADGALGDGVLHGDLVLYGTGDPTLSDRYGLGSAVWEAFADTLEALGVREIAGAVVGDASYFRGPGTGHGWQTNYIDAAYAAPASALSFAENIATIVVRPSGQVGWRPSVRLVPGGEGIAIVNQATTSAGGRASISAARSTYEGPLLVRGSLPRGSSGVVRSVPVSDPARFTAAVFREILERRGIAVAGGVRSVTRAEDSPLTGRSVFAPAFERGEPMRILAVHTSPPLLDVLNVVNRRSHNMFAEQTLRVVGRVATGDGSVEGGARAVQHLLHHEVGVDTQQIRIHDGSGLSPQNRATARSLVRLLAYMTTSPHWDAYWSTLPQSGEGEGSLRRMQRTPAEGNLRAKTGTLGTVSALSGYVRAANGELLAFSILSNDVPSTWRAKRVEDAVATRLATFDRGLVADAARAVAAADASAAPPPRSETSGPEARSDPPATHRTHTVRRGETLETIARRYGVTVAALRAANPGVEPRSLPVGRRLVVP